MDIAMPKLNWDESFCVGVPSLDEDDRQLFRFINDLTESMMGKENKRKFEKTLVSSLRFTLYHMLSEELLLYKSGYPLYTIHVEEHDKYINEIRRLYVRYLAEDTDSRILSAELIGILTELVQDHIVKMDKPFGEYVNGLFNRDALLQKSEGAAMS